MYGRLVRSFGDSWGLFLSHSPFFSPPLAALLHTSAVDVPRGLGTGGRHSRLWASKISISQAPRSRATAFPSGVLPAHSCPPRLQELLHEGYLGWKQSKSLKESSRA